MSPPLIPLLNSKQLDSLPPPSSLRFRLRLARFNYNVVSVPGEDLNSGDTLSRAPVGKGQENDNEFEEEVENFINTVSKHSIPATHKRLEDTGKFKEVT